MSILEILGMAFVYIVGTIVLLYLAVFMIGRMKGGLEIVALMSYAVLAIIAMSVAGGLFLLGGLIL